VTNDVEKPIEAEQMPPEPVEAFVVEETPAVPDEVETKTPNTPSHPVFAWICVFCSVLFLLNPTLGIELPIPDALPIIGNLDEVGATLLLLGALDHLGIKLPGFITRMFKTK
jgi:hypothetical protein